MRANRHHLKFILALDFHRNNSDDKGGEATLSENTLKAGCRSDLPLVPRVKSQRHFYETMAFIFLITPYSQSWVPAISSVYCWHPFHQHQWNDGGLVV
jgi:hypothetical protein